MKPVQRHSLIPHMYRQTATHMRSLMLLHTCRCISLHIVVRPLSIRWPFLASGARVAGEGRVSVRSLPENRSSGPCVASGEGSYRYPATTISE